MGWQTFLSYSRQQYHAAESLALQLQQLGIGVWFDVQQLEPGTDWQRDIEAGLDQSGGVLLLASRSALASPYVEREWRRALDAGHPVIVALIERVRLPRELRDAPMVDLRGDFDKGVRRLREIILNPQTRTSAVSFLPRFSRGVAQAFYALLLQDIHALSIPLVTALLWALLFLHASFPRYALEMAAEWALEFAYDVAGVSWSIEPYTPWFFAFGILILAWHTGKDILRLKIFRYLRRDLAGSILAQPTRTSLLMPALMWLALASGHLTLVTDFYSPLGIEPASWFKLAMLAALIVVIWLLYPVQQRLRPTLPNADLLRWAPLDAVPDFWRTRLLPGWTPHTLPNVNEPAGQSSTSVIRFTPVVEPVDAPVLDRLRPLIRQVGAVLEPQGTAADYTLLILSYASSRQHVADVLNRGTHVVGVIASRFGIPNELQALRQIQLIDYSRTDSDNLLAELRLLTTRSDVDRARLQPQLEPVSLKRVAIPQKPQQIARSLFSLLLFVLLLLGLVISQRDELPSALVSTVAVIATAIVLFAANHQARCGRRLLPRPGMIVLAFVPLLLFLIITMQFPAQVMLLGVPTPRYSKLMVALMASLAITTAWCVYQFMKSPDALGNSDSLGMQPLRLSLVSSLVWIASSTIFFVELLSPDSGA